MDAVTFFLLYGAVWAGVYLVGRALKSEDFGFVLSPLVFMYKTTAFNNLIGSLANKSRRLWRLLANVGVVAGVGLMVFAIYTLGSNLFNFFYHAEAASPVQPLLPLPGLTISWETFPYLLLAISLVLVTHELAHGVVARAENVPLKSAGVFIAVILFGGFVEPDNEQLEKSSNGTRLRVYAAGSFTNVAIGLMMLLLLTNFAATINPFYTTNYAGVRVEALMPGYPLEKAGAQVGDVIIGINGAPIRTIDDLQRIVVRTTPGTPLTITTTRETYSIDTMPDPKNATHGVMGINSASAYITYSGKLPFLPYNLPYYLLRAEFWISLVFINVGAINMLPLYTLDGDKFLETLLRATGVRNAKGLRNLATAISLAMLFLNFVMSYLQFGFLKL